MAISKAAEAGAKAVICASTGNTSASAAAYAVRAGMICAVLVPQGKIALGKMAQALVHGARLLQVDGNFDDCLELAQKLAVDYPVALVNSVNPDRIAGQKTAAFEICDVLGRAPDVHLIPVGNAGNITAYWAGYKRVRDGRGRRRARRGCSASRPPGSAPIVLGEPVAKPVTIATAIRIGNPASWTQAVAARDESGGLIDAVTDRQILEAYRLLARTEAVFVEPASAASVAGLLMTAAGRAAAGRIDGGLHGDRQRAQGSGMGDRRRAETGDGRRRRARRRRPSSGWWTDHGPSGIPRRLGPCPGPGDEREPRSRLRRARPRPRPARRRARRGRRGRGQ